MTEVNYERYDKCRFMEGAYGRRQADAALLMEDALSGSERAKNKFFEALSTSDTPALLAPALNRKIIDNYGSYDKIWGAFASKEVVDDFRLQEINKYAHNQEGIAATNAGQTFIPGTLPRIPEQGQYPVIGVSASGISFRVAKSGEQFQLSWERLVQDRSLRELERALAMFGLHAAQTEDVEATRQFIEGGIATALPVANRIASNPVLNAANLEAAYTLAVAQKLDGRPVNPRGGFNLLVPTELELTAQGILDKYEYRNGSDPVRIGPSPLAGKFTIVANEWFSTIDSTNGAKSWALAPKPGVMGEDQGVAVGFLRGNEAPELSIKSSDRFGPNGERIPGVSGDFDNDSFATRVRHTATGITKGFAGWVGSNGTGS